MLVSGVAPPTITVQWWGAGSVAGVGVNVASCALKRSVNQAISEILLVRLFRSTCRSRMDPRREAKVEAQRLHDPERRAGGKDIGSGENAGVLRDHRRRRGVGARVQVTLPPAPRVL